MRWIYLIVTVPLMACLFQMDMTSSTSPMTVSCNYSEESALIRYKGDGFGILAVKGDGTRAWFEEDLASASYQIVAYFTSAEEEGEISFDKGTGMNIYTLKVQVRKTFKEFESGGDEEYMIECNFENYVAGVVGQVSIAQPVIVPILVNQAIGTASESNITVDVVKMDGGEFTGPIALGRFVKLKIEMSAAEAEEVGFKATNCYVATDDDSIKNIVLVDGCGTGSPFKQDQGITATGLVAYSPVFKMFRMKKGQGIAFICNFVICLNNCDGSSCAAAKRKKRDVPDMESTLNSNHIVKRDLFSKYGHVLGYTLKKTKASTGRMAYYSSTNTTGQSQKATPIREAKVIANSLWVKIDSNHNTVHVNTAQDNTDSKRGKLVSSYVQQVSSNQKVSNKIKDSKIQEMHDMSVSQDNSKNKGIGNVRHLGSSVAYKQKNSQNSQNTPAVEKSDRAPVPAKDEADTLSKDIVYANEIKSSAVKNDVLLKSKSEDRNTKNLDTLPNGQSKYSDGVGGIEKKLVHRKSKTPVEKGTDRTIKDKTTNGAMESDSPRTDHFKNQKTFQSQLMEHLTTLKQKLGVFYGLAVCGMVGSVLLTVIILVILLRNGQKRPRKSLNPKQ